MLINTLLEFWGSVVSTQGLFVYEWVDYHIGSHNSYDKVHTNNCNWTSTQNFMQIHPKNAEWLYANTRTDVFNGQLHFLHVLHTVNSRIYILAYRITDFGYVVRYSATP